MSQTKRGFEVIGERDVPSPENGAQQELAKQNTQMLLLALRALSQRAVTAITNLFSLALVASAWWLWYSCLRDPSPLQLTGLGGYALFVLLIDIVRSRR